MFLESEWKLSKQQSFAEDFVLPDYQKLSVKNILPQIGAIFDAESFSSSGFPRGYFGDFQKVDKVVLFIFDGLGYNRLLHHLDNHNRTFLELAEKGTLNPVTSSTVLASLFTALSPAQHQILGYHMFSKKYGLVFDTLDMKPVYGTAAKLS